MWLEPQTLFWPLYGFAFERIDLTHWVYNIIYALFNNPAVYIPELVGAVILICFARILVQKRKILPIGAILLTIVHK